MREAIENLYAAFSVYTMPSKIDGCPCCISSIDRARIHQKPLDELWAEDLSLYSTKALTTWGDVNDLKYFLPRIFELMLSDPISLDPFIILGKLEYGKWEEWNEKEKDTIQYFLRAWWREQLSEKIEFGECNFWEIGGVFKSITLLLEDWNVNVEENNFRLLISFIFEYFSQYKPGKQIDISQWEELCRWLKNHEAILEDGFYKFEKKEPEFAQTISYCYDIVDRIKF